MGARDQKNQKLYNGIKFILYPIAFFALIAVICVVFIGPSVAPYIGAADLFVLPEAPDFNQEAANLYDENQEQTPVTEPEGDGRIPISELVMPDKSGDVFGQITISSVDIQAKLIYGDGTKELKKGVGVYRGLEARLPGQGRTSLMGGHRSLYLYNLPKVKVGDQIEINTSYGDYVYEVTASKKARYDDPDALDFTAQEDNIVLYTCYGAATVGATPYRWFVYAKYVSGPKVEA